MLPVYLFHFIRQESFRRSAQSEMTGFVGQKRVPADYLAALTLPIPPLAEQRRIVGAIDRLLEKVASARERLERVPLTLKRFRQAVLAAACSGRLTATWRANRLDEAGASDGDLPAAWRKAKLSEVIDGLKYGTSRKCDYETKGIPVLRIPNIDDGIISHDDIKFTDMEKAEFDQLRLREGDLLMNRSNGSVSLLGKTAIVGKRECGYAYAGYLIRIRSNVSAIHPPYLNAALASDVVRQQIEMPAGSTSGVNNINSEEVKSLLIPLPPFRAGRNCPTGL